MYVCNMYLCIKEHVRGGDVWTSQGIRYADQPMRVCMYVYMYLCMYVVYVWYLYAKSTHLHASCAEMLNAHTRWHLKWYFTHALLLHNIMEKRVYTHSHLNDMHMHCSSTVAQCTDANARMHALSHIFDVCMHMIAALWLHKSRSEWRRSSPRKLWCSDEVQQLCTHIE